MLANSIRHVYGYFRHIAQSAAHERPSAAVVYVVREIFNIFRGRFAAYVVGWPRSSLGASSRVLGSKGISVGKRASIKQHAWIEAVFSYNAQSFSPSITIGQNFLASERLHISAINRIEIGDDCLFGSGVYISDHNHGSYKGAIQSAPSEPPIKRQLVSFGSVVIGNNVWLGDNVVIVGPVKIGNGVVIGANSVVTRDIPDYVIAAGAPLKVIKLFDAATGQWQNANDKLAEVKEI